MDAKRLNRAGEAYQHEISNLLLLDTRDPRLADVTISGVKFTPDMKLAKVYFRAAGGKVRESEVIEGFQKAMGFFRRELSSRVKLKFAPELRFYYDDTQEESERIDKLFRKIEEDRKNGNSEEN